MKGLIVYAALLFATVGASYPTYNQITQKDSSAIAPSTSAPTITTTTLTTTREPVTSSNYAEPSSTAGNTVSPTPPQEGSESPTIILQDDFSSSLTPISDDPPRRRIVTYDQRQEGQYNIRADLDNFMIVMVPQEASLFSDMFLMKALKRNPIASKEKSKVKSSLNIPNFFKYRESPKRTPNLNYNLRSPLSFDESTTLGGKQTPIAFIEETPQRRLSEFVEARSPYHHHVDISSNDDEQTQPDRQVDVLPPPYPLAYQHLKPYHLEAEPTVIQALPPPEIQSANVPGNFLETYNQLLNSGLKGIDPFDSGLRARQKNAEPEFGFYRLSRAIRGSASDSSLDSDRSNSLNSLNLHTSPYPIYRSEHSLGAESLYPPIDVPKAFGFFALRAGNDDMRRNPEFLQETADVRNQVLDEDSSFDRAILPTLDITVPHDDVELELHGVTFLDRASKTLLSDGMERCAPGFRRDSYGLCREIEGY